MRHFILVIDEGTTGVQASVFDCHTLDMYGNNKVEFPQIYPRPGLVEQNPEDIWQATLQAIQNALEKTKLECKNFTEKNLVGLGLANQRETCLAWNRVTGECAGNALVWQDRRTAEFCHHLKKDKTIENNILHKTGLVCDPYFSATKMNWMLTHYEKAQSFLSKNQLALTTLDTYLIWKLTGGKSFVTEHTNASRTLVYNIHEGGYDPDLCHLFQIPQEVLPEIKASIGCLGVVKKGINLPEGLPILGVLGDQQAALLGQNCRSKGESKITFGTGAFLLMNVGDKVPISDSGLLTTVALSTSEKRSFALEGSAFIAGSAVQFLRDNFNWVKNSAESSQIALSVPRDDELFFVPSLAGLGAPYWNPLARGVLWGLTRGTQKGQIIRAVLESIALQNVQLLQLMEQACQEKIRKVGVDGGASRNDYLMQFQSDVLQVELTRPTNAETTSLGAARAALLALNPCQDISFPEENKKFIPQMSAAQGDTLLKKWLKAVDCVNKFYQ